MTDTLILPFIKSDILKSDIKNLEDAGILKLFIKNLFKAEIIKNTNLKEEEKQNAVKNLLKQLKLNDENLQLLEKKDPGFIKRFENEAFIREKINVIYNVSYGTKSENFFKQNKSKFNKYIYSLIRNNDRNTIFELYYQIESKESSLYELAKKYSIGNEKLKKGIIGPVRESDINPKILINLKSLDIGIISEPFQIANNWYIIQKESFIEANFNNQTKNKICASIFEDELDFKCEQFMKTINY